MLDAPLPILLREIRMWSCRYARQLHGNVDPEDVEGAALVHLARCLRKADGAFRHDIFWATLKWRVIDDLRKSNGRWVNYGKLTHRGRYELKTYKISFDAVPKIDGTIWEELLQDKQQIDPAIQALDADELERTMAAIAELPERLQYLLKQHVFCGKSLDELSHDLHISPSRTSQLLKIARNFLRGRVERS